MRSLGTRRGVALAVAVLLMAHTHTASAAVGDTTGDRIVGQPNASSNTPHITGVDASGLSQPSGVVFDSAGNLYVADAADHRVLGYRSPMTTDRIADLVIGQPDFHSALGNNGGISASSLFRPIGVAVTPAGDLYVADSRNNRVLEFDRPFATDTVADRVIGQPDFEANEDDDRDVSADTLSRPTGVAVDAAGDLWVADEVNHRVLEYDDPIATSDYRADLVLGQPSFDTNTPNLGGVGATSLYLPVGVAVDRQGNVWVADAFNHRVLEYDAPKRFDSAADRVLGQPFLTSNAPNYTDSVDAAGLNAPTGLSVDHDGNVYVCDGLNNRVLMYTSPIATADRVADRVFGQPDFNSSRDNSGGVSAETLSQPLGVALDPAGNLAVADFQNSRVVLLEAPTPVVTSLAVKVSPTTGRAKLVVRGFGMVAGSAVVEVDGVALSTAKYKEVAADGSAHRVAAADPSFDTLVPRGLTVSVTVLDPLTGVRSAPIPFTR